MKRTIKRAEEECNFAHTSVFLCTHHLFAPALYSFLCFVLWFCAVSKIFCDRVAKFRRWTKKIHNSRLLYLDETGLRVSESSLTTLVAPAPGENTDRCLVVVMRCCLLSYPILSYRILTG